MALSNERDDRCLARFGEIARTDAVRGYSVKGLCEGAAKGQVIPQGYANLLVMYTLWKAKPLFN